MQSSLRVFINTGTLYINLIITTVVSLFLTSVVLRELGIDNFGIYNLIGGIINLLAFFSGTLMIATQRYMSISIGKKDISLLRKVFSISLKLHWIFAVFVLLFLEVLTAILFDGMLNIPADKVGAAKVVYQIMVVSVLFTIMSTPYNAALNAHEHLWFFAIVEIITSILKLSLVFLLKEASDPLIFYSAWMLFTTVINMVIKVVWCKIKYSEAKNVVSAKFADNKDLVREMAGYLGWNSLSSFAVIGRTQGTAIILNVFFSTAINAVVGIANQVRSLLSYFSQMLTNSITPQIMKSKGEGDMDKFLYLSVFSCKLAFGLSALIALPILTNLPLILSLWLRLVPENTVIYCRLTLSAFLVMQLYPGLVRAILADRNIKYYQIFTSIILLLPLAISPVFFRLGFIHYTIFYIIFVAEICSLVITALFTYRLYRLDIVMYAKYVMISSSLFIILYFIFINLNQYLSMGIFVSLVIGGLSALTFVLFYYNLVFSRREKESVMNLLSNIRGRIRR
ncbi:hypothetical protein [Pedobacter faecalis]|uniref:hypothetical protein n=1 Tax=Pedobacter faecalis TaxID=3041495 RepID=UPI00254DC2AE|nr:hypothetical protein [Pedobacter sp. ELA7]